VSGESGNRIAGRLPRRIRLAVAIVAVCGLSIPGHDVAADSPGSGAPDPSAVAVPPPATTAAVAGETIPTGAPPAAPPPSSSGDAFGIRFDSDRPVEIRSDQLESSKLDGTRKLLFTKNVVVVQDDLTIRSDRLEAYYPPETSQPSRMIASGHVSLSNGDYDARCDEATYERTADTLTCRGNAEMREGDDCVAGKWIVFDLEADTVKVGGGATVVLGGENAGRGTGVCL